jgi:hypothetical protein
MQLNFFSVNAAKVPDRRCGDVPAGPSCRTPQVQAAPVPLSPLQVPGFEPVSWLWKDDSQLSVSCTFMC